MGVRRRGYLFRRKNKRFPFLIGALLVLVVFGCFQLNRTILPAAIAMSSIEAKNKANAAIDQAVGQCLTENAFQSSDFVSTLKNSQDTVAVNAVEINALCTKISTLLNEAMSQWSEAEIGVPLGTAAGLEFFSNAGPELKFRLRQGGDTQVDYETAFESAGINQTHFKIWLKIKITIQMVNPLQRQTIHMERKMMLLDMIIKGDVPNGYLGLQQ